MRSSSSHLDWLKDRIDITRVPFSDRGSRLLIFQAPGKSRLELKLAERLTELQPGLDAYRRRPPFVHEISLLDGEGEPLEFETVTYPHVLHFNTRVGEFGLVFQDHHTIVFRLPPHVTAGLRFHVSPQFWGRTERGGVFKAVRDLVYFTDGEPILNRITPKDGGYVVELLVKADGDCAVALSAHRTPSVPDQVPSFSAAYAAAEKRWTDWFGRIPAVDERFYPTYAYAWWIMANNLISPHGKVTYEAMVPSKLNYVGLWLWDSALHAVAYRHVDPELARNQIRAMLTWQSPNGMLPDAVHDEGVVTEIDHPIHAEVTKPPILAWAALKLHETAPDLDFLREIYLPLVRWNAWWFSMNDDDADGLVQYNHPYSSGLDDSPLWDYGLPVESPDLNTYLCLQMESLAAMAEILGMDAEAAMWCRRSKAIVRRMMRDFWDEEAGLFLALHEEKPISVTTPFNLYPLWTGRLPDKIRDRLIGHLTDEEKFWAQYPLPTVARDDPHFDPETMWRGPVWANINYFFVEALHRVGEDDLARTLRERTLELVMAQPSIYEYYNPESGEPPATAANAFGWTSAVFIDLAIQASREEEGTTPGEVL
ncbi:MAG: trehalase family glycosidase [Anaerolineae bacterium]|jgi:glycogen debranching enzyme